jgi:hypothetical protein
MNKAKKVAWSAANIILPLSESARIMRAMKYSATLLTVRVRKLRIDRHASTDEILSFDEAVRESGMSREALISRFLFAKRLWLLLSVTAVTLALMLPAAILLSELPSSAGLLARTLSLSFMLAGFSGLAFARALNNQFHLWHLQTRQLGSFAEWKASGNWLRDILSWKLR